MSDTAKDMALNALLGAKLKTAPNLSIDVIRHAYDIELTHQFNESPDVRLKSLQKLVEDLVASGTSQ